jgi:cytochrome c-type biogenesis protein CcmH
MTWFIVVAVAMVVIALAWIVPTLLRRTARAQVAGSASSNLVLLRDQMAEVERDVANGTLSRDQYEVARSDLERRVLEETRDAREPVAAAASGSLRTALALAVAIPVCAALLYLQLGTPEAVTAGDAGDHKLTREEVEAMVARLAERLEQKPDDANGWALLGRSYTAMQRYPDAVRAFERAAALSKDDAALLADYADALAMTNGSRINGPPLKLAEQALAIDPTQWKALALAGSAAFERRDYKKAVEYWEKLRGLAEPNSELALSIAGNIAEARELGKLGSGAPSKGATASAKVTPQANAGIEGRVSLSPALTAKAAPTDTVFIFARAAQGPRMPLAIVRRQVKDLPFEFKLDDTQAMAPELRLSNFGDVIVGARISKSATATPQSGDLQGASGQVKLGASKVNIVIDSVVP